jgi:hypothetical protein
MLQHEPGSAIALSIVDSVSRSSDMRGGRVCWQSEGELLKHKFETESLGLETHKNNCSASIAVSVAKDLLKFTKKKHGAL